MRITFLMPGYMWGPSGGYRVVYEYANQLVSRGHEVAVVHPRHLPSAPPVKPTLRQLLRKCRLTLIEAVSKPTIDWHPIDQRVRLLYVPSLLDRHIPDSDILFATAWNTARPVMECSPAKGEKCYLIQHYETWMGPKALVDETWRMPLRKIVIAQWLLDLGTSLGSRSLSYVPNGIDHKHYKITQSIEGRPRQVVMMCSHVEFKRSRDGIAALQLAKNEFPDLRVVLFGNSYRPSWVPDWMSYEENPPQRHIVEDFYNSSSIMLSPSLTEGFPLPPAEGAACGCAIVATDIGGHHEYLQNGVTALLSPAKDPHALARNLCLLLANDELRIRLARSANEFIKQFTWQRSADLLEDFVIDAVAHEPLSRSRVSAVEVSSALRS
jgi:glycosyltransferase involved in cell wall biosynthesis